MPADLPGLYFDPVRNRYFPLSSRPRVPPTPAPFAGSQSVPHNTATTTSTTTSSAPARRRRRILWSTSGSGSMPLHAAPQARIAESYLLARLAATRPSRGDPVRWPMQVGEPRVCAFRTTIGVDEDGRPCTRQYLGDSRGWVYSRSSTFPDDDDEGEEEEENRWTPWAVELSLLSEVSALCTVGPRCVGVCFGSATKICVQQGDVDRRASILSLSSVHDVRSASLQGAALVLGAARKAVLLPDIDASAAGVRTFDLGGSDAFAVAQSDTLVYAGTRAGSVLFFDSRLSGKRPTTLIRDPTVSWNLGPAPASSVVSLHPTRTGALIVAHADGRLASYDARSVSWGPTAVYAGHVGDATAGTRLGLALDSSERTLLAAGADGRLRAWGVGNGAPVNADDAPDLNKVRSPFAARFPTPLAALQVVDSDAGGAELWAGGGATVWGWRLGV